VIAKLGYGVIREAGAVLLDVSSTGKLPGHHRARLEAGAEPDPRSAFLERSVPAVRGGISLVSEARAAWTTRKRRRGTLKCLSHVTVEGRPLPATRAFSFRWNRNGGSSLLFLKRFLPAQPVSTSLGISSSDYDWADYQKAVHLQRSSSPLC